jgi:hypothetical protein
MFAPTTARFAGSSTSATLEATITCRPELTSYWGRKMTVIEELKKLDADFIEAYNKNYGDAFPYYEGAMGYVLPNWQRLGELAVCHGVVLRLRRDGGRCAYVPNTFSGKLDDWVKDEWDSMYKKHTWEVAQ